MLLPFINRPSVLQRRAGVVKRTGSIEFRDSLGVSSPSFSVFFLSFFFFFTPGIAWRFCDSFSLGRTFVFFFFLFQAFIEQTARTIEIDALDHWRFIRRRTSFTGLCIFLVTAGICVRCLHLKEIRNIADFDRQQVLLQKNLSLVL